MTPTSSHCLRKTAYLNEPQHRNLSTCRSRTGEPFLRLTHKPAPPPSTLKTIKSTSALPQNRAIAPPTLSRLGSSDTCPPPRLQSRSRKNSCEKPQETNWQDMEIPSELEMVRADTAEEIRNIVQESMDEHRALRASRTSQSQAIVVRTTITQSRTCEKPEIMPALIESSASASSRRTESSLSGDMSSTRSMGIDSATSVDSSERDDDFLKPPRSHSSSRSQSSEENSYSDSNRFVSPRPNREKPLRERGLFKILSSLKGEADCGQHDDDHSKLSGSSSGSEDRRYAIVVGDRYYCPSPGCARWTDVRYARAFQCDLRCRQCGSYVCTERRGTNDRNDQHRPSVPDLDAALPQAGRAEQKNMLSKEVTLISALNFPQTIQCLTEEEREAEEQRLAEDARRRTAGEYERLGNITEFFEHLRKTLEGVHYQQKQAIERRHRSELQKVEEKEAALVCGERILDRDQKVASERAELVEKHQNRTKDMRKAHAHQLLETVSRHRRGQDAYICRSNKEMLINESVDQAAVLEMLLQAQEVERKTLRSQQTWDTSKWERRGNRRLESFDAKTEAERLQIVEAQVKEAEEVTRMADAIKNQASADWQWFNTVFLDRVMMLGEDERRLILSGANAPELSRSRARGHCLC